MKTPVLYVFNISHYCEKARWALDHFGMDYEARHVMPGTHRAIAKKLGARRGSVPFLQTDDGVVAGSPAIIDWCEAHNAGQRPSLAGTDPQVVRAIEKRLDDVAGVHVRRFYYSDALLTAPAKVRPIFTHGLPLLQRAALTLGWRGMVPLMIKGRRSPLSSKNSSMANKAALAFKVSKMVSSNNTSTPPSTCNCAR